MDFVAQLPSTLQSEGGGGVPLVVLESKLLMSQATYFSETMLTGNFLNLKSEHNDALPDADAPKG